MKHAASWRIALHLMFLLWTIRTPVEAKMTLTTGMLINRVNDDLEQRTDGTEVTIPLKLEYLRGERFVLRFTTGYSSATVERDNGRQAELGSLTDSLLTVNYSFSGLPFNLACGLDVNLPTGRERLSVEEQDAIVGENNDLFVVERFGEGLNVGLSLSAFRQMDRVMFGLNGLYVYKGEYDPTAAAPDDDLDPGDQGLVVGLIGWQANDAFSLSALASYSYFSPDRVNGERSYQEGNTFTAGGSLKYVRKPAEFALSLQAVLPNNDNELVHGDLRIEAENSDSKNLTAALALGYPLSPSLMLEASGDLRYYTESRRVDPDNRLPYAGRRLRYQLGAGLVYAVNQRLSCSTALQYVRLREEKDIAFIQDRTFQGVNIELGISYAF